MIAREAAVTSSRNWRGAAAIILISNVSAHPVPGYSIRLSTRRNWAYSPCPNTGSALTKSELIAELAASNPHLRVADVELIVTTIFNQIADALARGERVELRGFGAFMVKRRKARIGHNPRTGEPVSVKEKTMPFFKAGKELRDRLNRGGRHRPASE